MKRVVLGVCLGLVSGLLLAESIPSVDVLDNAVTDKKRSEQQCLGEVSLSESLKSMVETFPELKQIAEKADQIIDSFAHLPVHGDDGCGTLSITMRYLPDVMDSIRQSDAASLALVLEAMFNAKLAIQDNGDVTLTFTISDSLCSKIHMLDVLNNDNENAADHAQLTLADALLQLRRENQKTLNALKQLSSDGALGDEALDEVGDMLALLQLIGVGINVDTWCADVPFPLIKFLVKFNEITLSFQDKNGVDVPQISTACATIQGHYYSIKKRLNEDKNLLPCINAHLVMLNTATGKKYSLLQEG